MMTIVGKLDNLDSLQAVLDDSSEQNMFRYDTGGARLLTIQICNCLDGNATSLLEIQYRKAVEIIT
jgi:hypothetical protein